MASSPGPCWVVVSASRRSTVPVLRSWGGCSRSLSSLNIPSLRTVGRPRSTVVVCPGPVPQPPPSRPRRPATRRRAQRCGSVPMSRPTIPARARSVRTPRHRAAGRRTRRSGRAAARRGARPRLRGAGGHRSCAARRAGTGPPRRPRVRCTRPGAGRPPPRRRVRAAHGSARAADRGGGGGQSPSRRFRPRVSWGGRRWSGRSPLRGGCGSGRVRPRPALTRGGTIAYSGPAESVVVVALDRVICGSGRALAPALRPGAGSPCGRPRLRRLLAGVADRVVQRLEAGAAEAPEGRPRRAVLAQALQRTWSPRSGGTRRRWCGPCGPHPASARP